MRDDERSPAEIRGDYARDAVIKEQFKDDPSLNKINRNIAGESARLRMDSEAKVPYHNQTVSVSEMPSGGYSEVKLETIEQERNRLSHKLNQTLAENEMRMRVLRDIIEGLERWQKNGYFLRDSINQSSRVQMDQVHQLRDYLK